MGACLLFAAAPPSASEGGRTAPAKQGDKCALWIIGVFGVREAVMV